MMNQTYPARRRVALAGWLPTRWLALGLAFFAAAEGWADLPTAQLTYVFPGGAKQGSSVEVTLGGANLDDVDRLLFSVPGITAAAKMSGGSEFEKPTPIPNVFTITVSGDTPPGLYEVRAAGRFGITNPRLFVVSTLEEVVEAGGNNTAEKAMEVRPGMIVNGRADANSLDFYRVALKQGERLLIDCRAERLDSRMNGALVLQDSSGRELMRNRTLLGRDPLLDFTAPAEGQYFIAVFDFVYAGGAEHFYRLALHQGPHVDFVFPPAGLPGATGEFVLYGRNLPGGQPAPEMRVDEKPLEKLAVSITLPADEATRQSLAVTSWLNPAVAAVDAFAFRADTLPPVSIYYADAPVVVEQEPNSQASQAQKLSLPCEYAGQFYPQGDEDWIQFDAKKGESYVLDLYAHRLGLTCDPFLMVQKVTRNDKGEESLATVAQVDDPGDRAGRIHSDFDTSTDDPTYRLDVGEDGTYRVLVRDQIRSPHADARLAYRLAIRPPSPDFELVAGSRPMQAPLNAAVVSLGGSSVRRGGTAVIEVTAIRRDGFTGDIELSLEGLPAGVQCPSVVVGAHQNQVAMIVTAAEDAPRWEGIIRIRGKARIGDQDVIREARPAATIWGTGNRAQQPPYFRIARDFALAVLDKETDAAAVRLATEGVIETSRGGKLEVPLKILRRGEFKNDLTLVPVDLPNELKPQNLAVKGDQGEINLPLAITNNNAKPGTYTFYLRADTKVKHVRNPEALAAAEELRKQLEDTLKTLTEMNQKAVETKGTTAKQAEEAVAAVKTAEQARVAAEGAAKQAAEAAQKAAEAAAAAKQQADANAGNQDLANAAAAAEKAKADADSAQTTANDNLVSATKALEEANAKAKAAEEAKAAAEKAAAELDAKLKMVTQLKQNADKRVEEVKKANNPTDLDTAIVSAPLVLRVVETPIKLEGPAAATSVKAGEKPEITINLTRLYGFDSPVDLTLEPPSGVTGISAPKLTIPKEQTAGKLALAVDPKATVGEHTLTVKAKAQFNNVNVEQVLTFALKVEPAP